MTCVAGQAAACAMPARLEAPRASIRATLEGAEHLGTYVLAVANAFCGSRASGCGTCLFAPERAKPALSVGGDTVTKMRRGPALG
jgi:hypothetical protein